MRRGRKVSEHRKRKQAKAAGLLAHLGHRSHSSGKRWLRPWDARRHQLEMKEMAKRFEKGGEM